MPTFFITDTITIARTWTVQAPSAEAASDLIEGPDWPEPNDEEQIDATPYQIMCVHCGELGTDYTCPCEEVP